MTRHLGLGVITGVMLALAAGPSPAGARAALPARAISAKHRHRQAPCQRQHGHTVLQRGTVRLFRASGTVYGCVQGSRRIFALWQAGAGRVEQVAGNFLAAATGQSNQYSADNSLQVTDLRSGASYSIASESEPIYGPVSGEPPTPGPWPVETFVLGSDGRTVCLYATFPAAPNPSYSATPTGQVLDVIGPHNFRRQLATAGAGEISSASLSYNGQTVTWTQNGAPQSASV